MTEYVEIITDAVTGEQTVRPFTSEEVVALEAKSAAATEVERATLKLSFAQLLIGLVTEGWMTEFEGEQWLQGVLPPAVTTLIETLPQNQQFAAKARASRPSEVLRMDSLVVALGAAQNKTPEEIDQFFRTYAGV